VRLMNDGKKIKVSAPGRLCLFGEHQDYLGLPVIAMPMDLRVRVEASPAGGGVFRISAPDTGGAIEIDPAAEAQYENDRDYRRSCVNVMLREGFEFGRGYDVTISGDIPIGKGCSSSSAMAVAWIGALERMSTSGPALSVGRVAELAHAAEVVEFGEPGGMMDHFTSAFGGVLFIRTAGEFGAVQLAGGMPWRFVLGDSLETKATTAVLGRARALAEEAFAKVKEKVPDAGWHTVPGAAAKDALKFAPEEIRKTMAAAIAGRDITRDALKIFESGVIDPEKIGALITEHHEYLSKYLGVSTEKIDAMVFAAIEAGAYGAKINGSGGGGCMFAYAPDERAGGVAAAVESAGGKAIPVAAGGGLVEETE